MDRRKSLLSSGLVGAGVLEAGSVVLGILQAASLNFKFTFITNWRINLCRLLCPLCRTLSTH
jgi:hypothetical protein